MHFKTKGQRVMASTTKTVKLHQKLELPNKLDFRRCCPLTCFDSTSFNYSARHERFSAITVPFDHEEHQKMKNVHSNRPLVHTLLSIPRSNFNFQSNQRTLFPLTAPPANIIILENDIEIHRKSTIIGCFATKYL